MERKEVERGLVGAVLVRPHILDEMQADEEWFSDGLARRAYREARRIHDEGFKPDLIAVTDRMRADYEAREVALALDASSAANWQWLESELRTAWEYDALAGLGRVLLEPDEEPPELIRRAEELLTRMAQGGGRVKVAAPADVLPEFSRLVRSRYENRGRALGPQTGLERLDAKILALEPRMFYAIGGRPSAGKSALAHTIAANLTVGQRVPTGIISLESATFEVYGRLYANLSGVDGRRIRSGFLSGEDFERMRDAEARLAAAPLYIWDKPGASWREIRGAARMMAARGVKVLILDYIQLVRWLGAKDRVEAAAATSTALKNLARELNIAVVGLAQLKREADERRPTMGDFQWASQIEQDADVVMLLWHPQSGDKAGRSFILLEKVREGATGPVEVVFKREVVRYEDAPREAGPGRCPEEPRTPYNEG